MEFFYKKETLIRTICFMSFFVAINVICSLVAVYVPLISVILIIFLPLTSAVVELNCKDRWFPIYAIATLGLSIVVSLSQIEFTIFYIVPSIFTGYIFGVTTKKKLPDMLAIFLASIAQAFLSYISIIIFNAISDINLFDVIAKILRISDRFYYNLLFILALFFVGLVQTFLSFIVVNNELQKMKIKDKQKNDYSFFANCGVLIAAFFATIFAFVYTPLCCLFVGISWFFVCYTIYYQILFSKKYDFCVDAIAFLIMIFVYAFVNKFLNNGKDFLLFVTAPFLISIYSILCSFLKKSQQ